MKPNIILLMSDQQRWDSLGCNGNRFVKTPNLDRLAANGANCSNSYTPWPVCTPARATMWTGVYPHAHKVIFNTYQMGDLLDEVSREKRTLFQMLQSGGYTTGYFGKWHLGDDARKDVDVWEGFNSMGGHWMDGIKDGVYKPDHQTDQLIDFMESQKDSGKPFFAVNGFYPPHDPYTAPKEFYEPYRDKGVPFAGYYAAVSALDHCVGRTVDALERLGSADNTIIVYYSDHGDNFKYREGHAYKFACYDDSLKVPLIIHGSDQVKGGTSIESMIGLQDLMPTVLDWAGLDIPDHLHGQSFAPLAKGENGPTRDFYYAQNITRHSNTNQRCIRTGKWKLILNEWPRIVKDYTTPNQLFDLEEDPEEELNLYLTPRNDNHNQYGRYPSYATTILELATKLKEEAQRLSDELGCDLAENCILNMRKRIERESAPSFS